MSQTKEKNHEEICEGLLSAVTITLHDVLKQHKVKFTKPQQDIVDKLLGGWKLAQVNSHRMASEFKWMKPGQDEKPLDEKLMYLEHAGSVSKAFWNIYYAVSKQTGIRISMKQYVVILS